MQLPPLKHEPPDFEEVFEVNQWQTRRNAMSAECPEVLLVDLLVRLPAGCSSLAHAHDNNTLMKIPRTKFCELQKAQLQLEVGAYLVIERIVAKGARSTSDGHRTKDAEP